MNAILLATTLLVLGLAAAPTATAHVDVAYLSQDCAEPTVVETANCVGGTYGGGTLRLLLHLCGHVFGNC